MKTLLRMLSLALLCAIGLSLTACSAGRGETVPVKGQQATKPVTQPETKPVIQADDLMEGVTSGSVTGDWEPTPGSSGIPGFAVRLFQHSVVPGKNTLVSPLSVLCALAMTANGAKGETLEQMEAVLGMPAEELNVYVRDYMQTLEQSRNAALHLANSVWFADRQSLTVGEGFLQTNADYFDADVYRAPFDQSTCRDINNWVKDKTKGMIPEILSEISDESVMFLINALAFEAEWAEPYNEYQVQQGTFTLEDGTKQDVQMMSSSETKYLETGNATGFIKPYAGGEFAFVALLPNEGVSVEDVVAQLDGTYLVDQLLANPQQKMVHAQIPKFESDYSKELSEVLANMGMETAFNAERADLSGLGTCADGNLFISQVLHKTFISVGERGTKAGAVTMVDIACGAAIETVEPKEVCLDRPFVYMLIDCQTNMPFFMGTLMNPEA